MGGDMKLDRPKRIEGERPTKADLFVHDTQPKHFVATVAVLPYLTAPDVLVWGARHFLKHSEMSPNGHPAYIECFATVVHQAL